MAFLATEKGSINEQFIIRLEVKDDKVRVSYLYGDDIHIAFAALDDAEAFMKRVNAR